MWKCKNPDCGKTFPLYARKTEERRPKTPYTDVTRVLIDRAVCPFCESFEIEEVKEPCP